LNSVRSFRYSLCNPKEKPTNSIVAHNTEKIVLTVEINNGTIQKMDEQSIDQDVISQIKTGSPIIEKPEGIQPKDKEWLGSSERRDNLDVLFDKKALAHLMSDLRERGSHNEAAGGLIGKRYRDSHTGHLTTEVVDYLPFPETIAQGSRGRVTMTPDAWSHANQRIGQMRDSSLELVGHAHSHPGYGIFLSDVDDEGNASFDNYHHLAVVYDPSQGEEGAIGVFSRGGAAEREEVGGKRVQFGHGYRLHRGICVFEKKSTAESPKRRVTSPEEGTDMIKVGEPWDVIDWKALYGGGVFGRIKKGIDQLRSATRF